MSHVFVFFFDWLTIDQSQLGIHDSELSIVMEDKRTLPSTMDGQPYEAGYHAATLRRFLWREHMGLIPAQTLDASNDPNAQPPGDCPNDVHEGIQYDFVADPLNDDVWGMWNDRASKNTEIYRRLFRAEPDDASTFLLDVYSKTPPFPQNVKRVWELIIGGWQI